MAWLSEEEFREQWQTDLTSEIKTEKIEKCLREARREITKLIGAAAGAEVEAESPEEDEARIKAMTEIVRDAQSDWAYSFLIPDMTARFRGGGVALTERDDTGNATNQYAKFADVRGAIEFYQSKAKDALSPFAQMTVAVESVRYAPGSVSVRVGSDW